MISTWIFLEDKEKILILGKFISDKEIVFELVLSEFKKITHENKEFK